MDLSKSPMENRNYFQPESAQNTITRSVVVMCSLGMIFYFYEYFLRVAPSVMSAELKETFGLGEAAFGHLAACYYYAYTPMQIPVGMMMDRFGPRRILTLACFLCSLGTYLFAATPHVLVAQIGRFMVGFGSAFAYVGVLKISNVWLPQRYFAFMAGLCSTLGMLGAISGEVSMTHLVGFIGWQATSYYSVVVGLILTLILWMILRDHKNEESEEKRNRAFRVKQEGLHNSLSLQGGDHAPLKTENISIEKNRTPLVEIFQFSGLTEMLVSRQLWINGLIGCLIFLPITGFAEIWAVSFLRAVGLSKHDAAVGSSMVFLGFAIGAPLWGWISDAILSRRIPLILGSFISAGIMALTILEPSTSLLWMYPLLFLSGFFAGAEILIFAVSNDLSRSSVSATAAAFMNMVVMIGGMIIPPVIGKFLDTSIQVVDSLPTLTIRDYSIALSVLPIALVLSGILSIILKESYRR